MATIGVKIDQTLFRKADALLGKMPIELREKTLKKAIRSASRLVAKETAKRITPPGYPGDRPKDKDGNRLEPLSKNVKAVIRSGNTFVAGFVGGDWPKGAHFHLVEEGHEKWLWGDRQEGERVKGTGDFKRVADETRSQQERLIISTLKNEISELAR